MIAAVGDRLGLLRQQLSTGAVKPATQSVAPAAGANGRILSAAELLKPALLLLAVVTLVMASALMVIYSAYEYRRLFNQHQVLVQQGDELQVEWGQLLLEQSAWGANNRVESLAEERLEMVTPEAKSIEIVRHGQ